MSNYTMVVACGANTLTFDITPKFFPRMQFTWKRSGHEVAVVDTVPVEGWFSENDPAILWAKWNVLRGIAHGGRPSSFIFRDDVGTVFYQFSHGHIQNLESVEEGGGFVNHIQFRFDVSEERGVTYPDLVDVTREDEEGSDIDSKGIVTTRYTREVSAIGVNGDLVAARSFVMGMKPSGVEITRYRIRETMFDGKVTGTWEYKKKDKKPGVPKGIKSWQEHVFLHPGQRGHRFYRTDAAPVLIRGGLGESRLDVDGKIEAYDKDSFPSANGLTAFHLVENTIGSVTENVLEAISIGAIYPVLYSVEDPSVPYVWGMDYNFTIVFGEEGPDSGTMTIPEARYQGDSYNETAAAELGRGL